MKINRYKKLQTAVLSLAFLALIASCGRRNTTIIATDDNGSTKKIEYSGQVVFSQDKTSIDYISEDGFVKFERNGRKIEAERNSRGKVVYKYDGGDDTEVLDADGKQFLAEAVQDITREKEKIRVANKKVK